MKRIALLLIAVAIIAGAVVTLAQTRSTTEPASLSAGERPALSAKDVRGATPYIELANEPAPKLIVDEPLPDLLDKGVVWIQWRAENVHIVPVFGKGALNASPRVGHLHVRVDDLPWLWADASDINTIDLAGMPWTAQGIDRVGELESRGLPRTVEDSDVHNSKERAWLSRSLRLAQE